MKKRRKKLLYKEWVCEWLLEKRNYIKESTYANYSNIVYNHLIPHLGNYRLCDIDNRILQNLILSKCRAGRLDSNGGLSDKTVRDIGTVIKLSLKNAMKNNLMDYIDLEFYYPNASNKRKVYIFSKYEQVRIIDYVMSNQDIKNMGILLCLYSGLRIGELCALKWKDINFKRNILTVNKTLQRVYLRETGQSKVVVSNPKTKSANREIPLNSEFAVMLKQFKSNNENYILSGSLKWIEPRLYRKCYTAMIKKTGISKIPFHSLRHTFASNCIRLGADYKTVSELLGHSSVNITLNIYVHPQIEQKKKCINTIYRENCSNNIDSIINTNIKSEGSISIGDTDNHIKIDSNIDESNLSMITDSIL